MEKRQKKMFTLSPTIIDKLKLEAEKTMAPEARIVEKALEVYLEKKEA